MQQPPLLPISGSCASVKIPGSLNQAATSRLQKQTGLRLLSCPCQLYLEVGQALQNLPGIKELCCTSLYAENLDLLAGMPIGLCNTMGRLTALTSLQNIMLQVYPTLSRSWLPKQTRRDKRCHALLLPKAGLFLHRCMSHTQCLRAVSATEAGSAAQHLASHAVEGMGSIPLSNLHAHMH